MSLHSKTQNETLNCKIQQKSSWGHEKWTTKNRKIIKGSSCTPEEKKTAGMIGMSFAQFSKDSDDLNVTISIGENYQKSGAKYSLGGNLRTNNESALKD